MEIDKEFFDNWRSSYAKMIDDALSNVCDNLAKDIRIYREENPPKMTKLQKFGRNLISTIFRCDDEFWKRVEENGYKDDAALLGMSKEFAKNNPEYSKKQKGLYELGISLRLMRLTAKSATDKWLLRVLRDFCEIYNSNVNITDIDAMVSFIKKEEVIKDRYLPLLDTIPNEIKETLDLNLDENLREFVQQFASTYAKEEEITLGGRKL